ncbi:hypothetical protein O0I10_012387 [Lichtheimia ornata]|uniref:Reverse transcriptase/retrotransposon-derived protein RNase H-like domain-containing protein n=1 Tax=Lichtheimia ornata TaxID=688661 RepID=A0AAD7USS3_9FUNG|nr:uncharacterized protein O0I10_012387 [Lichtheimia ornata]KAJ8651992.1 hypothetical protein O0I10_012387 [Lichtheimia ornata]
MCASIHRRHHCVFKNIRGTCTTFGACIWDMQGGESTYQVGEVFILQVTTWNTWVIKSQDRLKPTDRNVKKVLDMTAPKNKSEVRSFLGMVGYLSKVYSSFCGEVTCYTTTLIRNKVDFIWGDEQEAAFKALKEALVNPPVLAYPDPTKVQILTTDASGKGNRCNIITVSSDGSSDGEQVIAYASRALRGPEVRYATTHVEALAIVAGMYQFRHYLRGRKFVLYTDHSALTYILEQPVTKPEGIKMVSCNH